MTSGFFGSKTMSLMPVSSLTWSTRVPRRAAVGRLVEPALAAGRPQRPLRGDVDDVRVARIDQDLADVLGRRQPHALPRLAGVGRLVDAVAEVRAALAGVLAGAEPDDVRVLRIDDHAAERERAAVVEDRREGGAAVGGFPQPAERGGDVPACSAFFGSIAMSCTRPVEIAGPMLRNSSPLSTSAVSRSDGAGDCLRADHGRRRERGKRGRSPPTSVFDFHGARDSVRIRAARSTCC